MLRVFGEHRGRAVNNDFNRKYLAKPMQDVLDRVKPDVIIASQPAATELLVSSLGGSIPVITMSHGDPEEYFHTHIQRKSFLLLIRAQRARCCCLPSGIL